MPIRRMDIDTGPHAVPHGAEDILPGSDSVFRWEIDPHKPSKVDPSSRSSPMGFVGSAPGILMPSYLNGFESNSLIDKVRHLSPLARRE